MSTDPDPGPDKSTGHLPAEAVAAIERGDLIVAIKLVRDHTGLGLKESKDAVERYQSGDRSALLFAAADSFDSHDTTVAGKTLPAAAVAALQRGEKVEAIKLVREANPGLGLAQAKDLVESYAEQKSPSLYGGFADHPSQASTSGAFNDPMAEPGRVRGGQWRSSVFWIALVLLAFFGVWSLLGRL